MTLSVSVIIPAYNQSKYLGQAIESALNQTRPPLEVLVVDDGSTDSTPEVMASYGDRIRSIRQENAGVAAARNTGMRLARGDLIAFLDSDDLWLPRKLELQVQRFEADAEVGAAHCGVLDIDADGQPLAQRPDGKEGWIATDMLLFRQNGILCAGSTGIVTRAAMEKIGEFDVRLPPSEDWDYFYRIALHYKIAFVPEVLMHYRQHGSNGHLNINKMQRAMLIAFGKAFQNPTPEIARLKRRAYGNFHMVLAGSYFAARQPRQFIRHALYSVWLTPDNALYLLQFPKRLWQRSKASRLSGKTLSQDVRRAK